jgi:Zn-dependent M28 family amino/carboxypeptidase
VPYGVIARQHLVDLSEGIGRREPGSPEEAAAGQYVAAQFAAYGYATQVQAFIFVYWDGIEHGSANVIAVKPGESPREIIVGAHYDSTGPGQGADDNASGVAVMLEVAGRLRDIPTPYTIRFIAFGAEEVNLDGSHYYVAQMDDVAIRNTVGMINLDSLVAGEIPYIYGDAGEGMLRDWLVARAKELGLEVDTRTAPQLDGPDGTPCDCADYDAFQEVGIPFAYFEANNWSLAQDEWAVWHTANDTLAYLEATRPGRVDRHLATFAQLLYEVLAGYR